MSTNKEQLAAALDDIAAKLRTNAFPNESAISTGVVLRVLNILGWDTYNPDLVWPEYGVGGRVDFALCLPERKPAVFIEVKQPGKEKGKALRQLEKMGRSILFVHFSNVLSKYIIYAKEY